MAREADLQQGGSSEPPDILNKYYVNMDSLGMFQIRILRL